MGLPPTETILSILFNCPRCSRPVCQRAYTMSLALGKDEEQVCLHCLAEENSLTLFELFDFAYPYIMSRDCFKEAWHKLNKTDQCPLKEDCVFNKCFVS